MAAGGDSRDESIFALQAICDTFVIVVLPIVGVVSAGDVSEQPAAPEMQTVLPAPVTAVICVPAIFSVLGAAVSRVLFTSVSVVLCPTINCSDPPLFSIPKR